MFIEHCSIALYAINFIEFYRIKKLGLFIIWKSNNKLRYRLVIVEFTKQITFCFDIFMTISPILNYFSFVEAFFSNKKKEVLPIHNILKKV